jgi:hypothetical protein
MHFTSYLGIAWLAIAWFVFLATCAGALLQPLFQARRARHNAQPPVTAVLPIKLEHSGFDKARNGIRVKGSLSANPDTNPSFAV